jgi:hypothetical protein
MLVDVHQHLWSEPLLEALAKRRELPFVRHRTGLTVLHLAGAHPYVIDREAEEADRRATLVHSDGLDRALVCLSSPVGIEALPRSEAEELLDAYHEGALDLPAEFGVWGAVALDGLDPDDVDRTLARGCVGVSLPAGALASTEAAARVAPALVRLEERDAPLLVHPGPAPWSAPVPGSLTDPLWWPALTGYVSEMQAAWLTFVSIVRREHPRLRVVFAMLAGGAPLLCERLAARGGPGVDCHDPLAFYDCSSFGPMAIEAIARQVGAEQIVYGSDRPVVEPDPQGRVELAARGARLLEPLAVAG